MRLDASALSFVIIWLYGMHVVGEDKLKLGFVTQCTYVGSIRAGKWLRKKPRF